MSEDSFDLSQEDLASLLDAHDFKAPEVGEIRKGVIVSITGQGVILDLGLKRDGVVLPNDLEKLSDEQRSSLETNQEISVYVLSTGGEEGLIVSIHRALQQQDWVRAQELLDSGEIIQVEVETYNRGGLIVPFGGLRGFIPSSHHTELNPGLNDRARQRTMAKMKGQSMPARVIEVDPNRRRLVLSQRDAQKEWESERKAELLNTLNEGDIVPGRVSSLSDFGAFVDIGGADGLIHVSELAWHRVNKPSEVVSVGEEFDVYILRLDREGQRISLSRKKLLANPWDSVEERYHEGQLVEGTITRIVNYGAFVQLEPGVEGLLHSSRLARNTNVEDPREVVNEGEKHLLRIVNVTAKKQRIALSLKAVTAQEQIEWMATRPDEPEMADSDTEESEQTEASEEPAAETAAEATTEAEVTEEVAEAPEDIATSDDIEVEAPPEESDDGATAEDASA